MIFKYCPICKNHLTQIEERLMDCAVCGFHFYINPAPTNGLILENEKGEILLVKRKFEPKIGRWDLAGGFVEHGESIEDSMKREVMEELGIEVNNLNFFISTPDRYLYKGFNYYTLCSIFNGTIKNSKIKPDDDISGFKFFKKNEIPFEEIAFEGVKKALKKYLSSSQEFVSSKNSKQRR